jgi:ParB-like chromosome segregation protein Spo0J
MSKKKSELKSKIVHLPASDLVPSGNIRLSADRDAIDQMKANIKSKGLLQNLIGAPRASDGKVAIFAGGTRLAAILELIAEGALPSDYSVAVKRYDTIDPESPDAVEIAMSENVIRTQMDHVDECAAMQVLAAAQKTEEEIADIFGYKKRTVHERLLIAKLIPEAHDLLREKTRPLAWAHALTLADPAMQKNICDDIASNPDSWASGDDIRKFLTRSTIPAEYAIFDLADYKGTIVSDFFRGDHLADLNMFWTLQNKAVADLQMEVEAEGFMQVEVIHESFSSWMYDDEPDTSKAMAFIEVLPSGKVEVIRGKTPLEELSQDIATLDGGDVDTALATDEIADHEVRATNSICDYAAATRSAILQAEVSTSFRTALEYTVISMLGHRSASFTVQPFTLPGNRESHTGKAFQHMQNVSFDIQQALNSDAMTPERREQEIVSMVRSMKDAALQTLFTQLTAQRVGQQKRRGIDDAPGALSNVFGETINVRAWWTPDEGFFELMASEDLRRLASALLPGKSATRFASAKKKDLVRTLTSNFADARDGALGNTEAGRALNNWVPGVMSYPALIEKARDSNALYEDAADVDIDAMLFSAEPEVA